jgi:hypothetical protein
MLASTEVGLVLVMVGRIEMMVKGALMEAPLTVLLTVTWAVPAVAIRLAGTAAVSCEALTKVVASEAEPQMTVVSEVKLAPLTVNVKAALSALTEEGVRLVMAGGTGQMAKAVSFDQP